MPDIEVCRITRTYDSGSPSGEVTALHDLSLYVSDGSITAVVGPSGCGKTTLLNIVAGLDEPDKGTITADGQPLSRMGFRIGYLFQTPSLIPWRSVLQNGVLGCEILGEERESREARARELLGRYGLGDFLNHFPATLSQGMQQRIALIRVVLYGAEILLLDEPFRALDYWMKRELQRDLAAVVEENGITTLLVTHDIEEAVALADRIYVLSQRPGHVITEYDVPLPRAERLKADPGAIKEMTSVFQQVWMDLQGTYRSSGAAGL